MGTISTESIAGFAEMTADQKVEALLKVEVPDAVDMSNYVEKSVFDKKASEAASLSKQLKDRMTEEEQKKAEAEESNKKILEELETLRKDKAVSDYVSRFIAMGYTKELATDKAKAMVEGDMAKVFEAEEKHNAALEKKIKEDLINSTKKPDGSGGAGGKKEEDLAIEKAKELAKAKFGNDKQYDEIMSKYRR